MQTSSSAERTFSLAEAEALLSEQLKTGGTVIVLARGSSMSPTIRDGKTHLKLGKPNFPLRKYAIPFYKRENGQYVLHRVIGKDRDGYILRGDNQLQKEHGIRDEQIIGVLYAFGEGDDWKDPFSKKEKRRAFFLQHTAHVRALLRKLRFKRTP